MDKLYKLKTGDAIICSGSTPTGFLLKTFTSSEWTHIGLAVRFIYINNIPTISLTTEGELFIYETNTMSRYDKISRREITGAAFTDVTWFFNNYNYVNVRKLRDVFRTPRFAELTHEFTVDNLGKTFPSGGLPFIGVWLGVSLTNSPIKNEMFCSELVTYYYIHCIGSQYNDITKLDFNNDLSLLFGTNAPRTPDLYKPDHYTYASTPRAPIFQGPDIQISMKYADTLYIILQPLLIILVVMLCVWMLLPHV